MSKTTTPKSEHEFYKQQKEAMSKTLNRNLKVGLSNQIAWELEKLSNHDVSKTEATKNIMEYVENYLLKIDVKIEKED